MTITLEEACVQVVERCSKEFDIDDVRRALTQAGGERLVCSDDMWRYYGLKKVLDALVRGTDHVGESCAGLMSTLSVS
jgi:hypothetical protein